MKKYIISSAILLLVAVVAQAELNDFTADGNITVSGVLNGSVSADLFIKDGSSAQSWTHDADSILRVTNPEPTAGFRVGTLSTAVSILSLRVNNSAASEVACVDNVSPGNSVVAVPTTADTYSIVPSTASCGSVGVSSSGRSGGGGGGAPAAPVAATTTAKMPIKIALSTNQQIINFVRPLMVGSLGEDVRQLQKILNASSDTQIAKSGVGSPGNETNYFGGLTKVALGKFQLKHAIVASKADPGFGFVGPKTRAKLTQLAGAPSVNAVPDAQAQIIQLTNQLNQLREQLRLLQAR